MVAVADATTAAGGSSDAILAATYTLIHSFLISRSHDKAAAAVKKAANAVVILKDNIKGEHASLDEIIKWWRLKEQAAVKGESSSDSDLDSSSDSDSSDSSSSSDDSSDSGSDSSSSDSDSSSNTSSSTKSKIGKLAAVNSKIKPTLPNGTVAKGKKSGSENPADHKGKPLLQSKSKKSSSKASSSSGSSSDEDSSQSSSNNSSSDSSNKSSRRTSKIKERGTAVVPETVKVTNISVAVLDHENTRATKKQRTSENGTAVVTAVVTETTESLQTPKPNGKVNGKQPRKSNTPFQRIKAEAVEFHDERLKDNAFVARGASTNDYGARANQDLIVTRGDGFRKEKNKKKRGSYRGGEITMQSHSIKFT